jgi:hypothetical protein
MNALMRTCTAYSIGPRSREPMRGPPEPRAGTRGTGPPHRHSDDDQPGSQKTPRLSDTCADHPDEHHGDEHHGDEHINPAVQPGVQSRTRTLADSSRLSYTAPPALWSGGQRNTANL